MPILEFVRKDLNDFNKIHHDDDEGEGDLLIFHYESNETRYYDIADGQRTPWGTHHEAEKMLYEAGQMPSFLRYLSPYPDS
jgi:hypothetical protein